MTKKLSDVLAIAFTPKTGYTPAVGDEVKMSGDMEVDIATAGCVSIGRVEVVDSTQPSKTVIVRCSRFHSLELLTAGAAITVGAVIANAGSGKFITAVLSGEGAINPYGARGVAVEAASGDTDTFHALLF